MCFLGNLPRMLLKLRLKIFILKKRFLEVKGMRPLHCKFSLKNFCNEFAEMYEINDIQKTNHYQTTSLIEYI